MNKRAQVLDLVRKGLTRLEAKELSDQEDVII